MLDLTHLGFTPSQIHRNLSYEELYQHETRANEGFETNSGAYSVDTGRFTGRSPKDKFFVKNGAEELWWGPVNREVPISTWNTLKKRVAEYMDDKELYVTDCFCGAVANENRLNVRIVSEIAWQSHFCKNMFLRPEEQELQNFAEDFTIINACKIEAHDWRELGLNSPVFVIFNLEEKTAIIGGTWYGGEMKKGIFSVMNYYLPLKGVLAMHCSANIGLDGHSALFFGLSGTGKTTLSADPHRRLIGDDEHGWDDEGIFNFEGGCYAKTIKLSETTEPDIYHAIKRDALLENVVIRDDGSVDYDDDSKTKNTRVSYPIHHIDNIVLPVSAGPHPDVVIFLTCDAFGVLPPVSKLTNEQAMDYFISGYTAKVAGTELGVKEPIPDFSPCFGGPFLTLHPRRYAELLGAKLEKHGSRVYMINTGWCRGPYGEGERISLPLTRLIIDEVMDGSIENNGYTTEPHFGLSVPQSMEGIPDDVLHPEKGWSDPEAYAKQAQKLVKMFEDNHEKYHY